MKNVGWQKATRFEGPELSPGFLLWQVSGQWRRQVESILATVGLTHPQFVLLACIGWLTRKGNLVTQIELARFCCTDITMTSQVLRTLEKKGYIYRQQKEGDERSKCPSLTETGTHLVEKSIPLVEAVDHEFFGRLKQETQTCMDILQKLRSVAK